MIVFYLAGSRVTKVGHSIKKILSEEGNEEAGYRNVWQVLCNSLTAVVAGTLWAVLLSPNSLHATLMRPLYSVHVSSSTSSEHWCPLPDPSHSSPNFLFNVGRALIIATLGHFACCCGDTFASEVGVLARSRPRLVTAPWRTVPPGTNGGMSALGTGASFAGGVLVGISMALDLWIERAGCLVFRQSETSLPQLFLFLGMYGGLGGVVGSLVDSLLGATVQRSVYSKSLKMVLKDGASTSGSEVSVISGLNFLSNNQVNFVSSFVMASFFGVLAYQEII